MITARATMPEMRTFPRQPRPHGLREDITLHLLCSTFARSTDSNRLAIYPYSRHRPTLSSLCTEKRELLCSSSSQLNCLPADDGPSEHPAGVSAQAPELSPQLTGLKTGHHPHLPITYSLPPTVPCHPHLCTPTHSASSAR